jgi:2-polyprenyl-6-methoxyphenol hydroxylase-like FAD-dependent oxidoreductase
MLLGDAAALVHPFSGEGIAFALESGRLAAEVLADDEVEAAAKAAVYERRVVAYSSPYYASLGTFLAVRLAGLLPAPLGRLYTRTAAAVHGLLHPGG